MEAIGRIYARMIHDGRLTVNDVKPKYREVTIKGYWDLYHEVIEIPEPEETAAAGGSKKKG